MAIMHFISDLFKEPDGKWSLSRFTSAAMVLSAIVWVSIVLAKTHTLPDLTAPSIWAGGGATHYGIGKWFTAKKEALVANTVTAPPNVTS
jgi:hypothetical protein